jgi:hypothetical protein
MIKTNRNPIEFTRIIKRIFLLLHERAASEDQIAAVFKILADIVKE